MIEVFKLLGLRIIPSNQWTLAKKWSKQVGVLGIEDKREITGVLAVNMAGELLPPQIIYSGTTERCLPSFKFPDAWRITCSKNHWSTESTMLAYIDKVLKPYINSVSPDGKAALCLFDTFAAHKTESVKAKFESLAVLVSYNPSILLWMITPKNVLEKSLMTGTVKRLRVSLGMVLIQEKAKPTFNSRWWNPSMPSG